MNLDAYKEEYHRLRSSPLGLGVMLGLEVTLGLRVCDSIELLSSLTNPDNGLSGLGCTITIGLVVVFSIGTGGPGLGGTGGAGG